MFQVKLTFVAPGIAALLLRSATNCGIVFCFEAVTPISMVSSLYNLERTLQGSVRPPLGFRTHFSKDDQCWLTGMGQQGRETFRNRLESLKSWRIS
jgi:hypothetical protein